MIIIIGYKSHGFREKKFVQREFTGEGVATVAEKNSPVVPSSDSGRSNSILTSLEQISPFWSYNSSAIRKP